MIYFYFYINLYKQKIVYLWNWYFMSQPLDRRFLFLEKYDKQFYLLPSVIKISIICWKPLQPFWRKIIIFGPPGCQSFLVLLYLRYFALQNIIWAHCYCRWIKFNNNLSSCFEKTINSLHLCYYRMYQYFSEDTTSAIIFRDMLPVIIKVNQNH